MWAARRHLFASVGLALAVGNATLASAAAIAISPVVIEMDSPRRAVAVRVTNAGDSPVTLQTDVLVWQQLNGTDHNEPTDELLVVPPIVEVPPKSTQIFRVMLRVPAPSPKERSYRLILEEVSSAQAPAGTAAVSFKLTHSLPVMIAPTGKVMNSIRWKPCVSEDPQGLANTAKPPKASPIDACIRLLNTGNRRIKVQTLSLTGDGWQQSLPLKDGINILAGAEREWRVPLQPGQSGTLRGVQVQTARGETLQAEAGSF